jgi:hypothetical protein
MFIQSGVIIWYEQSKTIAYTNSNLAVLFIIKKLSMDEVMTLNELNKRLNELSEEGHRLYKQAQFPGNPCIGVRTERIQAIAHRIGEQPWKESLIAQLRASNIHEHRLMLGFMIASNRYQSKTEAYIAVTKFVELIINNEVCDQFVSSISHLVADNRDAYYQLALVQVQSIFPTSIRFGIVMLWYYFVQPDRIREINTAILSIRSGHHSVKHALVGLLNECYSVDHKQLLSFIQNPQLDPWVVNRTISRIVDSNRLKKPELDELYLNWRLN